MSDSGRQIGDCKHNQIPDYCVTCLRDKNAELTTLNNLLVKMIQDAHEACQSENMVCPWCTGHISAYKEEHDQFCKYTKLPK